MTTSINFVADCTVETLKSRRKGKRKNLAVVGKRKISHARELISKTAKYAIAFVVIVCTSLIRAGDRHLCHGCSTRLPLLLNDQAHRVAMVGAC